MAGLMKREKQRRVRDFPSIILATTTNEGVYADGIVMLLLRRNGG